MEYVRQKNFITACMVLLPYYILSHVFQLHHAMDSIQEAKRYIDSAKEILRKKAHKENGFYADRKSVRMVGNTGYNGILVALDGVLEKKAKGREDVN